MFENIFYQDRVVNQLKQEIQKASLPSSLLFHGPALSAKLTTALELTRALTCQKGAAWDCGCQECGLHRTLDYPYLFLAGHKKFLSEIEAAASLFLVHRTQARQYFFLRAVKKLLKRYDPFLWEGEENKLKAISQTLATVQEDLELLYPFKPLPCDLETIVQRLVKDARILAQALSQTGLFVQQVRRLAHEVRLLGAGNPKFILIENADKLQEGACNALLKILEEPPLNTTFLLLTSHKQALIGTISSRLRPFVFQNRSQPEQKVILERLFSCQEQDGLGLKEYFQSFGQQKYTFFDQLAQTFFDGLNQPFFPLENDEKMWSDENNLHFFFDSLVKHLRQQGKEGTVSLDHCEKIYNLFQEALIRCKDYRLNVPLVLESLFYQIKGL